MQECTSGGNATCITAEFKIKQKHKVIKNTEILKKKSSEDKNDGSVKKKKKNLHDHT